MTYTKDSAIEVIAATLIERILACRNAMDRFVVAMSVHALPELAVAADYCLSNGLLKMGTTNASAKVWSRNVPGKSDSLLYATKLTKPFFYAEQAKWRAEFIAKMHARAA